MRKIRVRGGRPLIGEITVSGSKNAALPIIFSCILINGVSEIENLPDIGDTRVALEILRNLGAEISKEGSKTYLDTRHMAYSKPDGSLSRKIRASTYLLGGCLGRFGICHLQSFGGCNFSHRPIDMHISASLSLGCRQEADSLVGKPSGGEIHLKKPSVGATVNSILMAAVAEGKTEISGVAREPHIDCLVDFLLSAGADITPTDGGYKIVGRELHGGKIRVIDDMIEAGSYLALALLTEGRVTVKNCPTEEMTSFLEVVTRVDREPVNVVARPYPDFPTDLQPIVAPLLAKYRGGKISDTIWEKRLGYLDKLASFGVKSNVSQNYAEIFPSHIHSGITSAPDLRGGFACLMCALMAEGESIIYSPEIILRGYEDLDKKLSALGAEIIIEG